MGAKDSKPSFLAYEDAVKRVTISELRRLKDSYKRLSTANSQVSQQVFIRDILGDVPPQKISERIYTVFGGTSKGISFKDLLSGLVLLTKGKYDERVKFIYGFYVNQSFLIEKQHIDSLLLATEGTVPISISQLFLKFDTVNFERFKSWLVTNRSFSSISRWLLVDCESLQGVLSLSSSCETPTFHQTLSGVTHLEESEIMELEKHYWLLKSKSMSGKLDLDTFKSIVSPPLSHFLYKGLFQAFDDNQDGHLDFRELVCGISACCRGPLAQRHKFVFKIFDLDKTGTLTRDQVSDMVSQMLRVRQLNCHIRDNEAALTKDTVRIVNSIFSSENDDFTSNQYVLWAMDKSICNCFLQLLFEICHVLLGLKPGNIRDEADIISGWLDRTEVEPFSLGQVWYLVAIQWWNVWCKYVDFKDQPIISSEANTQPSSVNTKWSSKHNESVSKDGITGLGYTSHTHRHIRQHSGVHSATLHRTLEPSPVHSRTTTPEQSPALRRRQDLSSSSSSSSTTTSPSYTSSNGHAGPTHGSSSSLASSTSPTSNTSSLSSNAANSTPATVAQVKPRSSRPSPIDNTPLLATNNTSKMPSLTNEGGKLRRDKMLTRDRDFKLLPKPVWRALSSWYGFSISLPRTVVIPVPGDPMELELYPYAVRLYRHQTLPTNTSASSSGSTNPTGTLQRGSSATTPSSLASGGLSGPNMGAMSNGSQVMGLSGNGVFSGLIEGFGSITSNINPHSTTATTPTHLNKYHAHTASFSSLHTVQQCLDFLANHLRFNKDDIRLWLMHDQNSKTLLDDERKDLKELGFKDECNVLLEVRSLDQTWPEEMEMMKNNKSKQTNDRKDKTTPGLTGLNNLGNTCFMNAALQCISNTKILTKYFSSGTHFYELNKQNPVGMKGVLAMRYGELINDLWKGGNKCVAPLKLRWTIGKYEPRFSGFQQHDSQELLLFVLDGLHEDLNRVHKKPYVELKDSDGRPDEIVANEAWENHRLRNQSIIIDLFHGQMKSTVQCCRCQHTSVRFEVIPPLSLPLPVDNYMHTAVIVLPLDGSTPNRYTIRMANNATYGDLKSQLYHRCRVQEVNGTEVKAMLLFEVNGAVIKNFPKDDQIFKPCINGTLYAYEITTKLSNIIVDHDKPGNASSKGISMTHNNSVPLLLNTLTNGGEPALITGATPPRHAPMPAATPPTTTTSTTTSSSTSPSPSSKPSVGSTPMADGDLTSTVARQPVIKQRLVNFDYVVALHRKMYHMDTYFLSAMKTRPSLFGTPIIVATSAHMLNSDLYSSVWHQVARFMSPETDNHAHDGDTGKSYPFTLKMVTKDGLCCSICPWNRYCLGCSIANNCHKYLQSRTPSIAIDWEPTALHLRYQTEEEKPIEKNYNDQLPTAKDAAENTSEISLHECLQAFTSLERLDSDQLYYCSTCEKPQMALKKLDLWKLPPILVIHLKRFQLVNNVWVKSQKSVQFPFIDFKPSSYVSVHGIKTGQDDINSNETTSSSTEQQCNGVSDEILNSEYDLYAISCHSGMMGAGHYVCYAKTASSKWYCFNDSSCKEVNESEIDHKSAYIMFYERKGLDIDSFIPSVKGKCFDSYETDADEFDSDFKKTCTLQ